MPEIFDWVTARHQCSLGTIFHLLLEVVDTNVKTALALGKLGLSFNRLDRKVVVSRQQNDVASAVVFELTPDAIAVKQLNAAGQETPLFTAKPCLGVEGDCLLEVEGNRLTLWQVSRRALEALFFGE